MPKVGNREEKPRKSRKYESAEELEKAINAYFDNPDTMTYIYKGEPMEVYVMTIEHIAINHLGFKSKQSLYDYRNRLKSEGYDVVIDQLIDRLRSYWQVAGEHGNGAFAALQLSTLGRDKERIKFEENADALTMAKKIIESAAGNDISLETMQKLMQAVKQKADIENGTDTVEALVRHVMPVPTAASIEEWEKASKEVHDGNLQNSD